MNPPAVRERGRSDLAFSRTVSINQMYLYSMSKKGDDDIDVLAVVLTGAAILAVTAAVRNTALGQSRPEPSPERTTPQEPEEVRVAQPCLTCGHSHPDRCNDGHCQNCDNCSCLRCWRCAGASELCSSCTAWDWPTD